MAFFGLSSTLIDLCKSCAYSSTIGVILATVSSLSGTSIDTALLPTQIILSDLNNDLALTNLILMTVRMTVAMCSTRL